MPSVSPPESIRFLLSIDTEEEWDWNGPYPQDNCSVENIDYLPACHEALCSLGVRPTYFVDYAVADNSKSADVLRNLVAQGNCEIGAHLHPWCNPPYVGVTGDFESHVVNLPIDLVEQKLDRLTATIRSKLGVQATSFRTGRWGINKAIMDLLEKKGYLVDSSVYPLYSNSYFSCDDANETPYWPDSEHLLNPGVQRQIYEVPITAGFNRTNFKFWNKLHKRLSRQPWKTLRLVGALWHMNALRKLYLSPELATEQDMIKLVDTAIAQGHRDIHMFFHSSSLLPGASCFKKQDQTDIVGGVTAVVEHLKRSYNVEFCTVSERHPTNSYITH